MIAQMEPWMRHEYEFVPQAIIKQPPAFFSSQGVIFRTDLDDLNTYEVAELQIDKMPFSLMRHAGTPPDETEVCLPTFVPLADLDKVLGAILAELHVSSAMVAWQRRDAKAAF